MGVGAGGIRPPEAGRIFTGHNNRIADLERQVASRSASQRPTKTRIDVPFSYFGALAAAKSPRWYPEVSRRLTGVVFSLETAGGTASTFKVYRTGSALTPSGGSGGVTVASTLITLASGSHFGKAFFDSLFSADVDYLQVELVTVGTAAADLVAQARLS